MNTATSFKSSFQILEQVIFMSKYIISFLLVYPVCDAFAGADPMLSLGNESPVMNFLCIAVLVILVIGGLTGGGN